MDLTRPLSLMSAVRIQLTMLTSSAPQNAGQKPATWKPETNTETSHRQKALSTSRKRPRVSSVIGNVSTTRTGRTIALTSPSSNPATTAEASPSSRMPGTTCAASKSPSVYTTIRRMNPMARVRVYTLRVAAGLLLLLAAGAAPAGGPGRAARGPRGGGARDPHLLHQPAEDRGRPAPRGVPRRRQAGPARRRPLRSAGRRAPVTTPPVSHFVTTSTVPWVERRPGVFWKTLWEEGAHKAILMRYEPGATVPRHRHIGDEQIWVLEGSVADDTGVWTAGNYAT